MIVHAKVKGHRIVFSGPRVEQIFLDQCEGKDLIIQTDEAPTSEIRRYFEGAIVPAFFWLHPEAGWRDFRDARAAIKYEFNPGWTKDRLGKSVQYAKDTKDMSKTAFNDFVQKITAYIRDNFDVILDPEEYKAWRDSAPPPGAVYPQHARLREAYSRAKGQK